MTDSSHQDIWIKGWNVSENITLNWTFLITSGARLLTNRWNILPQMFTSVHNFRTALQSKAWRWHGKQTANYVVRAEDLPRTVTVESGLIPCLFA